MTWKQIKASETDGWSLIGGAIPPGGGWCDAAIEWFAQEPGRPATHVHFYTTDIEQARTYYRGAHHMIPEGIITFSLQEG